MSTATAKRPKQKQKFFLNQKTIDKRKKVLALAPGRSRFTVYQLTEVGMFTNEKRATAFLNNLRTALVMDREPIRLRREGDMWYFDQD